MNCHERLSRGLLWVALCGAAVTPEVLGGEAGETRREYKTPCSGDFNGNGIVEAGDLNYVLGAMGPCDDCSEDLNRDGFVDEDDVVILIHQWGRDSCPQEEAPCPGDLNADRTVDSRDLAIVLGSSGDCAGCEADLTGDGRVDQSDIDMLLAHFGSCEPEDPVNEAECLEDFNADGMIDGRDLAVVLGSFGQCRGLSGRSQ